VCLRHDPRMHPAKEMIVTSGAHANVNVIILFVTLGEPPSADPHAGWYEGTRVNHPLQFDF